MKSPCSCAVAVLLATITGMEYLSPVKSQRAKITLTPTQLALEPSGHGTVTVACAALATTQVTGMTLSRVGVYGSTHPVRLAEAPNLSRGWDRVAIGDRPDVETNGDETQHYFRYTMNKATCLDAGRYICTLAYVGGTNSKKDEANLPVTVMPAEVQVKDQDTHVMITPDDPSVNLSCSGSVGTLHAAEEVRWVWEVKPIAEESDVGWQSVTHSQVTVTIEDDSDPCSVVQTSTLSLQPALDSDSSSSWSYRCYVKKNNVSYSSLALIYQVDVVVGKTEGINATAQNVNADNGGKAKNDLIKWLLVFGVGILVVILIGAVVFAVRTVVPKAEKITAEATRPIHKHTARSWSTSGATQGSSIAMPVYNKHPQHGFPDSEESSNSSVSSFSSGMHASGGVGHHLPRSGRSSHSSSHQIPRRTKKQRKKRKKEKKRRRVDENKSDSSIAESKDDNENESDGDNDSGSDDSDDEDTTIYDEEPKKKYRSHSLSHMFADGAM